jgi:hypothetical protein
MSSISSTVIILLFPADFIRIVEISAESGADTDKNSATLAAEEKLDQFQL